jgi:PKHD-type hydroxylase
MEPYLITSRKGIYLNFTKKLIDGKFFGLTHQGPVWYAFGTHADDIHKPTFEGYILKFEIDSSGNMANNQEIITGLDNGVHQMCIWRNHLYVLETYVQRITVINLKDYSKIEIFPFDRAISAWYQQNGLEGSCEKYIHMNAITVQDDRFYIMCPKLKNTIIDGQPSQERKPSHIFMFSPDWKVLDIFDTGRYFCHDLVIIGHEIHFADATNTICKLNIVTREVEQVWDVDPVSPDLRKICRGLSISETGQVWVGTHDLDGKHHYVVDPTKKQHIELDDTPCCIKRIDGTDFNDETSSLKKTFTLTYPSNFSSVTSSILDTLRDVHTNNQKPAGKFENLKEFLNPDFSRLKDGQSPNTTSIPIPNLERTVPLPYYLTESGPFYLYPENHIMDWHTNITQSRRDENLLNFRMYTVNTTGNSYFMYRHPISNKIHAIKDIDGTSLIFNIFPEFWHAVICVKGSRLSYGVKFSEDVLDILGIDDIWQIPKKPFRLVFPTETNDNMVQVLQLNQFMNENEINKLRTQMQKYHLQDGGLGNYSRQSDYRRSKIIFITKTWEFAEIYLKIFDFVKKINSETFKFNLSEITSELQYTEYDESYQGHYDSHLDMGPGESSNRKLSIVIQLSDPLEYEGGELQIFQGGNPRICDKSKGSIIIFPSYLLHKVTPVTKGTRRSLVLWVSGPPFV